MNHARSRISFGISLFVAVVAGALGAPAAHAESDARSRSLAVELFDQAEALFAAGQTAQACPKYAESFRLDPQLGVLIYLAECYEKNGQISSAWGTFREAEEMAAKRGDERYAHAHERATALAPRVNHLVLVVTSDARVPGLEVLSDGLPIAATLWGTGAPIDAGKHQIIARAPGYKPFRTEVQIVGEGRSSKLDVPKLAVDPTANRNLKQAEDPGTSQRIAAIAVGGVGLVGLGVGGFFGLSAQSTYSDSKALCNDANVCTPHGTELRDSASNKALVSTITCGVGIAALGTAAVLWFTAAKKPESPQASHTEPVRRWAVGPSVGVWGLEARGAF